MSIIIIPIPAFNDNYIWLLHDDTHAIVVDPGVAAPVNEYLNNHGLTLKKILITHHHWDHVNGLDELQAKWSCEVYAPKDSRIPGVLTHVREGDGVIIAEFGIEFNVLETPGHTISHICYFNDDWLFCGDTLFSMGCGRMFEGAPAQYVNSLNKIKQLPSDISIYCTHEYTSDNIAFALTIEPDSKEIMAYKKEVDLKRLKNLPSLPVHLKKELAINPFLRVQDHIFMKKMAAHNNCKVDSDVTCFAMLRAAKDQF